MNPELGNREFETAKLIASKLLSMGFEVRTGVAKTGIVALLRGAQPGQTVPGCEPIKTEVSSSGHGHRWRRERDENRWPGG